MSPVQLGPFTLEEPIARGAMGVVWRGEHRERKVPVAVKVITVEEARDPRFQGMFRAEVRAVASLDHPGIVTVLDFGTIDELCAEESDGEVQAKSPFLVMEFIDGFSLEGLNGKLPWTGLKHVLLGLLDALAHAHARGVIHRDLKPANVLLSGRRRLVKLTDFGVAHALEVDDLLTHDDSLTGTPNYMAPEQVEQRWRDYGPWTDLYGLGCLAWNLATGKAPFERDTPWLTMEAHCKEPVPELAGPHPMPRDLEAWIRRLLCKRPRDRFRRAADAAWALLNMDEQLVDSSSRLDPEWEQAQGFQSSATITLRCMEMEAESGDAWWSSSSALTPGPDEAAMPIIIPPLPSRWRRTELPSAVARLEGVGLNLFGIRSIPMVDREPERDAMWSALRQVRDGHHVRIMLLRGKTGCGKSRLAQWLYERAHEVGGGTVLRAVHSPVMGPAHGLGPMVARFMRTQGMDRDATVERISSMLTLWGATDQATHLATTELVSPSPEGDEASEHPVIRLTKPSQRFAILHKLLRIMATERPVIMVVEDAHWAIESLGFVEYLIHSQERFRTPVLVLLTATEELLRHRPAERTVLDELRQRSECYELVMASLKRQDCSTLMREQMGLEAGLVKELEPRVRGNPLFATQLVAHWASRGMLVPTEGGFALDSKKIRLPADMTELWTAKIDDVLQGRSEDDRLTLEAAAVLGQAGVQAELDAVCEALEIQPGDGLMDALMDSGLARGMETGRGDAWAFAHRSLLETFVLHATQSGRVDRLNRVCAEVLGRRSGEGIAERVGLHRLAAGDLSGALEPLRSGADEHLAAGRLRHAKQVVARREEALEALGVDQSDPMWGAGWAIAVRADYSQGDINEAISGAERFEASARQHGWTSLLAVAVESVGEVYHRMGDYARCEKKFAEAIDLALDTGDRTTLARARRELGKTALSLGAAEKALQLARLAREDYQALGSEIGVARSMLLESFVTKQREDWEATRGLLNEALDLYERAGYLPGMADCYNQLGELARLSDKHEAAERAYRDALALIHAVGSGETIIFEINLALTLVAMGRYRAARPELLRALAVARREQRRHIVGIVRIALLCTDAAAKRWDAWDRGVPEIESHIEGTGFVDMDVARCSRQAATMAARAGEFERARWGFHLALDQFNRLGLFADAQGIEYTLRRLPKRES